MMVRFGSVVYNRFMVRDHDGQELSQIITSDAGFAMEEESKSSVSMLGAAGVGLAGAVAGASLVMLLGPWGQEPPPVVSVKSCAQQYETIADTLGEMVEEGVAAGKSTATDVAWLNSLNGRQQAIEDQLEDLRVACVEDDAG